MYDSIRDVVLVLGSEGHGTACGLNPTPERLDYQNTCIIEGAISVGMEPNANPGSLPELSPQDFH